MRPVSNATVGELSRGELHLALGPRAPIDGIDRLVHKPWLSDRFLCALRRGHPASRGPLTLARYLGLSHVAVATDRPTPSSVQLALRRLGHERRVQLALPSYSAVLACVQMTDAVAAIPERLGQSSPGVVLRGLPFATDPMQLGVAWHPRWTVDARHRWLRELLFK